MEYMYVCFEYLYTPLHPVSSTASRRVSHEFVVFPDGLRDLGFRDSHRVYGETGRHRRQIELQRRLQVLVDTIKQVDVHLKRG